MAISVLQLILASSCGINGPSASHLLLIAHFQVNGFAPKLKEVWIAAIGCVHTIALIRFEAHSFPPRILGTVVC